MAAENLLVSKRQIAYLHVLANRNGLSDTEYREILASAAGVASATELKRCDFDKVLDFMSSIGLDVGERHQPAKQYGERPGFATPRQMAYLEGLSSQVFAGDKPFQRWLEHYFKVSHPRFLTQRVAGKAIDGLKAMKSRGNRSDKK